jgi:hypothetical protein
MREAEHLHWMHACSGMPEYGGSGCTCAMKERIVKIMERHAKGYCKRSKGGGEGGRVEATESEGQGSSGVIKPKSSDREGY